MERRTSHNEVRVFKFGARKGTLQNEEPALDQIWLQNRYRNALAQIDREFRDRYNAIVSEDNSALDRMRAIGARIKELQATIKQQRTGVQRSGWKALSLPEKAEIRTLTAERKSLKPEADRIKQANKSTYQPKIKALDREFYAAIKAVKAKFAQGTYVDAKGNDLHGKKLFWMNEEHVYNNFLKDRAAAMRDKTVLRFHRFEGEGVVTCRPRVQTLEALDRPITVLCAVPGAKPEKKRLPPGDVDAFLAAHPGARIARADARRFERFRQNPSGGTQRVQRHLPAAQAFQADNGSAFHFTLETGHPAQNSRRSQRRKRAFAHLQIGTDPKTFFTLPVVLHRDFPPGARITAVAAKRERVGRRYRWSLLVTVDFPCRQPAHGTGVVALDPGWARGTLADHDGRLRVGGLTDEGGRFRELALPPRFLSQVEQVSRLQSQVAKLTNEFMPAVRQWLDGHREESELRAHLHKAVLAHDNAKRRQREAGGFRHLIRAVRALRGGADLGDPAFAQELENWHRRFRHLDEWMRNLADQNNAAKLHLYRVWAADAARRYHTVVIDDADLRKAAEAPGPETDRAQVAGGQRQAAAPSLLVVAFVNAFKSAGGEVRWVLGKTSRTCSECGRENPPLGAGREFRCARCDYAADREFNSGRNLLQWHCQGRSRTVRQSTRIRKPAPIPDKPEVCEDPQESDDLTVLESTSQSVGARARSAAS